VVIKFSSVLERINICKFITGNR